MNAFKHKAALTNRGALARRACVSEAAPLASAEYAQYLWEQVLDRRRIKRGQPHPETTAAPDFVNALMTTWQARSIHARTCPGRGCYCGVPDADYIAATNRRRFSEGPG